jgi:hypothetical protein
MRRFPSLPCITSVFAAILIGGSQTARAQAIVEPGTTHVFGDAISACDPEVGNGVTSLGTCALVEDPNIVHVGTALAVAINESISIRGVVGHPFSVPGTTPTVLDATVSARASWVGRLFAAGVAGNSSSFELRLVLRDVTTNVIAGSVRLHDATCEGDTTTTCERNDSGSTSGGFPVKVTRGHSYLLLLEATCASDSGLVGAHTTCLYLPNAILSIFGPPNGRVRLDEASISIETDLVSLITSLHEKVDALQASVDELELKIDENSHKLDEAIRLLNTPQGRRQSEVPACGGKPCDFPDRPR